MKPYDAYIGIRILRKLRDRMRRIAKREFRGNMTAAIREAMEEYADRHEAEAAASRRAKKEAKVC